MTTKYLALLTLDEAMAQSALEAPSARSARLLEKQVNRRPLAPSSGAPAVPDPGVRAPPTPASGSLFHLAPLIRA